MNLEKIKNQLKASDQSLKRTEMLLKKIEQLSEYEGEDRVVLMQERIEEMEKERGKTQPFIAKSGLYDLDYVTEGFRPGQLIVLSGPTKNGKSSFCRYLTQRFSHNCKILWFPYEETHEEMVRHYSGIADFYVPRIMTSGNLDWVEERIIEAKAKYQTQIVFIDHLDFLRDEKQISSISINMASYVGSIVQRLKRIAVEQEMCIFLMCHIKKNNWHSNDLPTSEDIRDSGQIPQLADTVLMLKRDIADGGEEIYEDTCVLGIIENRFNGRTKKIKLIYKNGTYEQLDTVHELPPELPEEPYQGKFTGGY